MSFSRSLCAALLVLLAGCGGGDEPTPTRPAEPAPQASPTPAATPDPGPARKGVLADLGRYSARKADPANPGFPVAADGVWPKSACVDNGYSLREVDDPFGDGGKVGRFEVRQGDQGAGGGGDRCELLYNDRAAMGQAPYGKTSRFFAVSFALPEDFPSLGRTAYTTVAQFHQSKLGGPSPIAVQVQGPASNLLTIKYRQLVRGELARQQELYRVEFARGEWQDLVFEVLWSPDPAKGRIRILHQGRQVAEANGATLFSAAKGFVDVNTNLKVGNYRAKTIGVPSVVYHRRTRVATSYEALAADG